MRRTFSLAMRRTSSWGWKSPNGIFVIAYMEVYLHIISGTHQTLFGKGIPSSCLFPIQPIPHVLDGSLGDSHTLLLDKISPCWNVRIYLWSAVKFESDEVTIITEVVATVKTDLSPRSVALIRVRTYCPHGRPHADRRTNRRPSFEGNVRLTVLPLQE